MLFLWSTNKLGKIWIDGDSFRQIISKRLPEGYYCQELSFIGDENLLNIYITLPENDNEEDRARLENKIRDIFTKSGMTVHINWINIAPQDNPKTNPVWTLPLFWAGAAASLTALVHLGLKGILWSLFAAIIGYGVSWILLTEDGKKQVSVIPRIEEKSENVQEYNDDDIRAPLLISSQEGINQRTTESNTTTSEDNLI